MADHFASCAPGLEAALALELQGLGLFRAKGLLRASGGIPFSGSRQDLYAANLRLRTADRVLLGLGRFPARTFPELRHKAARLPWKSFLKPGQPVAFKVECAKSKLFHESAVAERIAGAISDSLGAESKIESREDSQLICVRIDSDLCSIRLDSSGAPLHKRGYRLIPAGTNARLSWTLFAAPAPSPSKPRF
jgi:putative N6-adenine-specific DNA methylase